MKEWEESPWLGAYNEFRLRWAPEEKTRYKQDPVEWFAGSSIRKIDEIEVADVREISIDEMVYRSLSKSNTSPASLGDRRGEFERELRELLAPYTQGLKPQPGANGTAALKRCPDTGHEDEEPNEAESGTAGLKSCPDTGHAGKSLLHEKIVGRAVVFQRVP